MTKHNLSKATTTAPITNVLIKDIQVSDRIRESVGDISDLLVSIRQHGLMNPIILDEGLRLIAGERRYTACRELNWKAIPARIIPGLTTESRLILELVENVARRDFTWFEECELLARLHEVYTEQHNKGRKRGEKAPWSARRSAETLAISPSHFQTKLDTAYILRELPILKQADNMLKARKQYEDLKRKVDAQAKLASMPAADKAALQKLLDSPAFKPAQDSPDILADVLPGIPDQVQNQPTLAPEDPVQGASTPTQDLPSYQIASFQDIFVQLPAESLGFIEADPPYAIDFNNNYMVLSDANLGDFKDWTVDEFHTQMKVLLQESYRTLADNSWLLIWAPFDHISFLQEEAKACGFKTQLPGAWVKPGASSNSPATTMVRNMETFLLFRKGNATFNTPSFKAAIFHNTVPPSEKIHPTEKPVGLYNIFFDALVKDSYPIFSAFAGSGNVLLAAYINGHSAIGSDMSDRYLAQFTAKLMTLRSKTL